MSRGAFIVLEGVDRSGKSSQSVKLVESLKKRNIEAERIVFPDRTTSTGQVISKYLCNDECKVNDQTIHLLFSANRWECLENIKSKINKGVTLIVDRYSYSGVAFSAAKGLDLKWCMHPENGLPKPDLVFLLDIKPEDLKDRPGFGSERYETLTMQKTVSDIFKQFAKDDNSWKIIDANRTLEEVHNDLLEAVEEKILDIQKGDNLLEKIESSGKTHKSRISSPLQEKKIKLY